MTAVRLFVCHSLLIGIMFSVVHADWTLSVRLISYYKPYSVLETAGATGTAFCCCDCSFIGFTCCDRNVHTANGNCVVRKCPTHFRVCARQGSGSEICSSTTSPFELDSNFTFSEGGTYGGLENPIQLTANQDSTSDKITLVVSIMEEGSFGQSPSLGSSTVMIPPQTTTTYTRMTFNNNKEKPLTAQLTYAYKLNCSDCPSGNPNNTNKGTNNINNINNGTDGTTITNSTNTNGTDGTNITSVNVNCSLSVRLISYHKPYSVLETAGATGTAYCCCDCSNTGFRCCDRNVDTANSRCAIRNCPTRFRVCAKQGSGSEICSSTTSPFELNSNFTFGEGGTYGGLENPIQLTANNLSSDNNITLFVSIMEEGSFGQSPSLGSFTVMIPPQTTTTYTSMTLNNTKEKPLTAQLIYAYKLNCSAGNGSNGINTTDSTTSTSIYSTSSTGSLSTPTGSPPSSTGSSTGSPPSSTGSLPSSTGSPPSSTGSSTGSLPSSTGSLSTSSTGSLPSSTGSLSTSSTGSPPSPTGRLSTSFTGSPPSSTGSPPSPTGRLSTSFTGSPPSSTGSPPSPTGRLSTSSTGSSSQGPINSPTGSPSPTDRPTDNTNRPTTNYPTTNRPTASPTTDRPTTNHPTDSPTDGIVDNNRSSGTMIKSSLWMLILITLLSAILIQF